MASIQDAQDWAQLLALQEHGHETGSEAGVVEGA